MYIHYFLYTNALLNVGYVVIHYLKDRGDLIYVGLLLSNTKTSETVEKHLNSDNSNLVFISIGIGQPEEFIKSIFEKAEELISNPDLL